jgi:phosphoribosyl-AMP cyclohydrolase
MTKSPAAKIQFDSDGLVPAVVQDADSGAVLMLAYMNEEALALTFATGKAHYWSRGRRQIWKKGETSGHSQIVDEVRINCERNSILLLVHQIGAVCHDGYPTCFYRQIGSDGSLSVISEQAFDPAVVYGPTERAREPSPNAEDRRLADLLGKQFAAYVFLREHDLTAVSATSTRLRSATEEFSGRVADELRELAGVLEGKHRHSDFASDLRLEASQVLYWVIVEAVRRGISWEKLRPDKAMDVEKLDLDPVLTARLVRAEAEHWSGREPDVDFTAAAHASLAIVAAACRGGGLEPCDVVERDLEELKSRPYLSAFFGHRDSVDAGPE